MDTYDLYGIEHDDLDAVRSSIEKALNIKMAAHESEYLGGLYYRFEDESGGLLELYTNYN